MHHGIFETTEKDKLILHSFPHILSQHVFYKYTGAKFWRVLYTSLTHVTELCLLVIEGATIFMMRRGRLFVTSHWQFFPVPH